MPTLIDEPELLFTRRFFEGAARRPVDPNPQAQYGAWMVFQDFLRSFEQNAIWVAEKPSAQMMQTYRAVVTSVLAMGEQLLTMTLESEARQTVSVNVRALRDKLVLEFSEATHDQSEKLLASIFGRGILGS